MFEKIKKAVRGWMQRAGAETGMSKEFKDIFEVGGVPAFNQFYYFGIFVWKYLYKGFYKAWHRVAAPTIANPRAARDMERMDMAKAVCAELSGLVWSEQCEVHVSQGDGQEQPLEGFVLDVLTKNNFWTKMQEHIEQTLALGGGAIKAWYEERHDSEGNVVPGSGQVKLGFCMADQFVPTGWDNAKVYDAVFIDRKAKDGYYYTRLEWHKWDGLTYWVTNELYRADMPSKNGDSPTEPQDILGFRYPLETIYPFLNEETPLEGLSTSLFAYYRPAVANNIDPTEPQDILGFRYPLETIYPFLNEETPLEGLSTSLFAYYRPAVANNIDDNSPLGVSIYANALGTLKALDIAFDSFVREFRLGKKRIIVPAQCIRTVTDPTTGEMRRYFDASDEVYEALSTDDPDALKIQDNSVSLRVEEHVAAINALLSILCLQVGFSAGTFTFDSAQGLKTATEVISENSKTYKTIKGHQLQVKMAIDQLVTAIIQVAAIYDVQWEGYNISSLAEKGWESKIVFDDSILQDRQTNINEGVLLVGNGLMSKLRFMVENLGMTEDEARREIQQIAEEGNITGDTLDKLDVGGAE